MILNEVMSLGKRYGNIQIQNKGRVEGLKFLKIVNSQICNAENIYGSNPKNTSTSTTI